jgi:hypothetical protein
VTAACIAVYLLYNSKLYFMRFSFFTAIFAGIINALGHLLFLYIVITQFHSDEQDLAATAFVYLLVFIFAITALLLFVSAYKIRRKMKADEEREMQNAFLNA